MTYLNNRKFGDSVGTLLDLEILTASKTAETGKSYAVRGAAETVILSLPESPDAGFECMFFGQQAGRTSTITTQGSDAFVDGIVSLTTTTAGLGIHVWYIGSGKWVRYSGDNPWTLA